MGRGGYRAGAGRPRKTEKKEKPTTKQSEPKSDYGEDLLPLDYMLKVMNDPKVDASRRDRMAIAAAPFMHGRKGEGAGKKEEKNDRAKAAATGRFASSPAPLKVVK